MAEITDRIQKENSPLEELLALRRLHVHDRFYFTTPHSEEVRKLSSLVDAYIDSKEEQKTTVRKNIIDLKLNEIIAKMPNARLDVFELGNGLKILLPVAKLNKNSSNPRLIRSGRIYLRKRQLMGNTGYDVNKLAAVLDETEEIIPKPIILDQNNYGICSFKEHHFRNTYNIIVIAQKEFVVGQDTVNFEYSVAVSPKDLSKAKSMLISYHIENPAGYRMLVNINTNGNSTIMREVDNEAVENTLDLVYAPSGNLIYYSVKSEKDAKDSFPIKREAIRNIASELEYFDNKTHLDKILARVLFSGAKSLTDKLNHVKTIKNILEKSSGESIDLNYFKNLDSVAFN